MKTRNVDRLIKELTAVVNREAAQLHHMQGQTLKVWGSNLAASYFDDAIERIAAFYQDCLGEAVLLKNGIGLRYICTSLKGSPRKPGSRFFFETIWLAHALLGIALVRQSSVIHREPSEADGGLLHIVDSFLKNSDSEGALTKAGVEIQPRYIDKQEWANRET